MSTLAGRVALITGASSGIGAATAIQFSKLGANVSITGRNEANLDKTKKLCIEASASEDSVLPVIADLSEQDQIGKIVEKTLETFGKLDILVNNAATTADCTIEGPIEAFDKVMAVNVRSVIILTKLCLPHLIESKGSIVNVSSIASTAYMSRIYYGISKAAIDHFTKSLALDLAPKKVRVNSVNPGAVNTSWFNTNFNMTEEQSKKMFQNIGEKQPMGRVLEPEEVAKTISFLASDDASFTTGQNMILDGAATLTTCFTGFNPNK